MEHQQLYKHLHGRLASSWKSLPDMPGETPTSTLHTLWRLAAGQPAGENQDSADSLPALSGCAADSLVSLVEQRLAGVPLAYLTRRQVFLGVELVAAPGAMIPRKETEILARAAVDTARQLVKERGEIRAVDLCTGSGNLALVLARHVPNCRVTGADISPEAVELACENARHLGLEGQVRFCQGDLFSPFETGQNGGPFDLIVCNPPYLSSAQVDRLPEEIRSHEPRLAFDGGAFGVQILTRLVEEAPRFLKPASWLCFEVGAGQGKPLARMLMKRPAYHLVETFTDEAGEIRALRAQTQPVESTGHFV